MMSYVKQIRSIVISNYFTQTSNKEYDRHYYKVNCIDGSAKVFQLYDEVIECYWNNPHILKNVEVLDIKPKGGKGF